eukprot:TRINITY_DN3206_c0_g1_i2.p1 TRINITY_DN3206_c0_g1~~TRINITY_DN3206_c0_g1_i2.p1  ORF type:complete len:374 (+),score=77.13 TRINITY_DN3206_c0_g1_i2:94-1122(+)
MATFLFEPLVGLFRGKPAKDAQLPRSPTGFFVEGGAITFVGEPGPQQKEIQILECPDKPGCSLGVIRGFLSPSEADAMAKLPGERGVKESKWRQDELPLGHRAFDVERTVRLWEPKVYHRLISSVWNVDSSLWRQIGEGYKLHAELEYVECDTQHPSTNGQVGQFCDNDGMLSMIVMLSESSKAQGGTNYFENGTAAGRRLDLKIGDAVVYNSEACEHWITPVTDGHKKILQLELHEGYAAWSNFNLFIFCFVVAGSCAVFHIFAEHVFRIFFLGIVMILMLAGYIFGSRDRFRPALRASPKGQALLFATTFLGYMFFANVPNMIQHYYDTTYGMLADKGGI